MKDGIILYLIHFWQLFLKQQPRLQKQQQKQKQKQQQQQQQQQQH